MNLFWKIFLGFWLSLLLMALGAVTMVPCMTRPDYKIRIN